MRFQHDMEVLGRDGKTVGHLDKVVLDPETLVITHVVVRKGILLKHDRVVPLSRVAEAGDDEERIKLALTADEAEELPELEEKMYIPIEESDRARLGEQYQHVPVSPDFYLYPNPYGIGAGPVLAVKKDYVEETKRNIPDDTVALKIGAKVLDSEGQHVGNVEELLTDDQQVTSFVLSQGVIFKDRKRVPVVWVESVTEEAVHLNERASRIESLPTVETMPH